MLQDSFLIQPQQHLIECRIVANNGSTKTQNPFAQQDYFIGRPIIGLQFFTASDMPSSPISGLPVIPDALFINAFLNINRAGIGPIVAGVWYKNVPLVSLRHTWNNSVNVSSNPDMFRCDPMTIQWPDSNIAFPTPQNQAAEYSVPVLVTYLLREQSTTPYRMAFFKGEKIGDID